jgi:hypothetical protein
MAPTYLQPPPALPCPWPRDAQDPTPLHTLPPWLPVPQLHGREPLFYLWPAVSSSPTSLRPSPPWAAYPARPSPPLCVSCACAELPWLAPQAPALPCSLLASSAATHPWMAPRKFQPAPLFLLPYFFLKPAGHSLCCPERGELLSPLPAARHGRICPLHGRPLLFPAPSSLYPARPIFFHEKNQQRAPFLAVHRGARRLFVKMCSKPRTTAALQFILHFPIASHRSRVCYAANSTSRCPPGVCCFWRRPARDVVDPR